jgi:hypothetical protein
MMNNKLTRSADWRWRRQGLGPSSSPTRPYLTHSIDFMVSEGQLPLEIVNLLLLLVAVNKFGGGFDFPKSFD